MLVSCTKCGRVHDAKFNCQAGKPRQWPTRNSKADKVRHTNRWTRTALQVKEDAQYLCEYCRGQGRYIYDGLSVHHIVPLEEDTSKAFDYDNLICLCSQCHEKAERGDISREELAELARLRAEKSEKT